MIAHFVDINIISVLDIFVGKTCFRINFNANLSIFATSNDVPNLFDKDFHQESVLPFGELDSTGHKMAKLNN